jgi:hypothetical protein
MRPPVRLIAALAGLALVTPIVLPDDSALATGGGPGGTGRRGNGPDFNDDGYADLVMGDGYLKVAGVDDAGAIWVVPGGPNGPRAANAKRFSQATAGVAGNVSNVDYFGYVWTTGNFNGDRFDDLAVGVLGEDVNGQNEAGAVTVLFGSASGLRGTGSKTYSRNTAGVPGVATANERWCEYGLAAGDFNGDGKDELVVASNDATVDGVNGAGSITVLRGSATGPTGSGAVEISQASGGVAGNPESGGRFASYGFGVGDFNRDGRDDLTVGMQYLDVGGVENAGGVYVFFGSGSGLRTVGSQLITRATTGVPGNPIADDNFGYGTPAIADWNRDGFDDIVISDSESEVSGQPNAGQVIMLVGSASGLKAGGGKVIHQNSPGVPDAAESGDYFGYPELTSGDFNGDGRADLAVASSYEDSGVGNATGAFFTFPGTSSTIGTAGAKVWSIDSPGVPGTAQPSSYFSEAPLWTGDFDGDGYDDIVASWSYASVGAAGNAGYVMVFRGSPTGTTASGIKSFRRSQLPGGTDVANTYFGYAV